MGIELKAKMDEKWKDKVKKLNGSEPTDIEKKVANEFLSLENNNVGDLKAELKSLYFLSAKEIDVGKSKTKALIITVPFKLLKSFHSQKRIVGEMEKRLKDTHVVIVGHRTILNKNYNRITGAKGPRPRSGTLTHVQEAILDDIVYPTEIVGKRTRCKLGGQKLLKVHLHPNGESESRVRLDTYQEVYKHLTNKDVSSNNKYATIFNNKETRSILRNDQFLSGEKGQSFSQLDWYILFYLLFNYRTIDIDV